MSTLELSATAQTGKTGHDSAPAHPKLGELESTAICGNDIASSCCYVAGIGIMFSGVYAPLVLLGIVLVLVLYRYVYQEVVEALPINGGAYNCILNATSKRPAAVVGLLTLLSYVATAVISAKVGSEYLLRNLPVLEHAIGHVTEFVGLKPAMVLTLIVLFAFAALVVCGVKDSAKVAIAIFVLHLITLTLVVGLGVWFFFSNDANQFGANAEMTQTMLHADKGSVVAEPSGREPVTARGGVMITLFLAFSACLLGVSGFESSANFVEEQRKKVFRKTLRNMTIVVGIFNPLTALVALVALPYVKIVESSDFLIADVATAVGGEALGLLVSIDAFLVLCGAVLTSYIGTSGLASRMSGDGCMPHSFLRRNNRGAFPRIVWAFFALCVSILLLTQGELLSLAGVYTIAFLAVMCSFALGNLLLGASRPKLKRTCRAPRIVVVLAALSTAAGVLGNILIDPRNPLFFSMYFVPGLLLLACMLNSANLLRWAVRMAGNLQAWVDNHHAAAVEGKFAVFIRGIHRLGPALDYIQRNEQGREVVLVVCNGVSRELYLKVVDIAEIMQEAGLFRDMKFRVVHLEVDFGAEAIKEIAEKHGIPAHRQFIGAIEPKHSIAYEELGGVRIIHD